MYTNIIMITSNQSIVDTNTTEIPRASKKKIKLVRRTDKQFPSSQIIVDTNTTEIEHDQVYNLNQFVNDINEYTTRNINSSTKRSLFDNLVKLYEKFVDNSGTIYESKLIELVRDKERVMGYVDSMLTSSKKSYYYSLSIYADIKNIDIVDYGTKYKKYNLELSKNSTKRQPLDDDKWTLLNQKFDNMMNDDKIDMILKKENITLRDAMVLQSLIIMIIYIKLPYDNNVRYIALSLSSTDNEYYENNPPRIIVKKMYGNIIINIPLEYCAIFDKYYKFVVKYGNNFFITERKQTEYSINGYSNKLVGLFGCDTTSLKRKREQIDNNQSED